MNHCKWCYIRCKNQFIMDNAFMEPEIAEKATSTQILFFKIYIKSILKYLLISLTACSKYFLSPSSAAACLSSASADKCLWLKIDTKPFCRPSFWLQLCQGLPGGSGERCHLTSPKAILYPEFYVGFFFFWIEFLHIQKGICARCLSGEDGFVWWGKLLKVWINWVIFPQSAPFGLVPRCLSSW